jgi:predicted outer membrane repeat protein
MQDNVATVSGGAIYIVGATTYSVMDSIFLGNAVVPASRARTASYALRIFTGAMGAGSPRGLMWSVDDGPVFGLSTADCSMAQNSSARGVERGLAPSWPGAASCAAHDGSFYKPLNLYTRTLKLAEGDHVLHIGALAYASDPVKSWYGGAWIDVGGLLDPTFPRFDDDRTALRHPGCLTVAGFAVSCPGGEAVWIEVPLRVTVGQV